MSKFIHLHTHSHYSLLDGLSKVTDLVKTAKSYGMDALALTDHGAMYGAIDFYMECKKAGIKPIIGVEGYLAARGRADKESGVDSKRNHITLLAKNEIGYKNLIKLTTLAHLEGFYYKPRIDKEILRQHAEGIICLSGCPASEMGSALRENNIGRARELIHEYQDIFGKENYFLEIMAHSEVPGWENWKNGILTLAKEFNIPIVGTHDSHYLMHDDQDAHEALLRINTGADARGNGGMSMKDGDYHLINTEEAEILFKDIPGAVENTTKVADMCNVEITLGKFIFPEFKLPPETTTDEELRRLALLGMKRRGLESDTKSLERLEYELGIIKMKGYAAYFLVVEDLIRYAHENGILTNIRGSVAGSMTTYVLGITSVNPLEYKLPFERFLNPDRPSAPDIDMDFADNRRDEVIEYAKKKYGADRVAQIGTFGTMMARGSVRDVARALGYPYDTGDRISKMIPLGAQGMPMTIDHAMELIPELKVAYETEKDTKQIIDLAKKIEGSVRHISVHAAGVVIAPKPLTEYVPLQFDPKGEGKIITQYDMYTVGEDGVGLTKFDFLGIRNLSILGDAVALVKQIHDIDVDLEKIPLDDKKTFELLALGQTEGLFQLNGSGMTRYLKELKPTSIHDINAMVALYRPGPMESIPEYIRRKHNPSLVRYLDPRMKDILDTSYGVLTYQDDVMMIAIKLGGYSWIEADKLRKAMGKKIPAEMEAQREKLIQGLIKNGMSAEKAKELWLLIEPFAAYGFNKAHAASYGRVSYQTAYMKAHYPVEYMTAIMTAESGDVEKVAEILDECKHMRITVLPPDVNESFGGFTVIDSGSDESRKSGVGATGVIRFGLYTIKNLGTDIADAIIAERKAHGPFKSIGEFLDRIHHKNLNKKSLEALIKTGAMDSFGDRGTLFGNIEGMLEYHREAKKNVGMTSLFGDLPSNITSFVVQPMPAVEKETILAWEKELLGLYVSGHPLDKIRDKILARDMHIKKILESVGNGMPIVIAVLIDSVRPVITKNNDRMAFIKISDFTGSIEAVVFPKLFKEHVTIIVEDVIIAIEGKVTIRNGEKSIAIEKIKRL